MYIYQAQWNKKLIPSKKQNKTNQQTCTLVKKTKTMPADGKSYCSFIQCLSMK